MPIFEYQCKQCNNHFEELVFSSQETPLCPSCGGGRVEKQLSTFGVSAAPDPGCVTGACRTPEAPACGDGTCGGCWN